jgi:hypothetical protein
MKKGDHVEWRVPGCPTWAGVVTEIMVGVRWTKGFPARVGNQYNGLIRERYLTVVKPKTKTKKRG